MPRSTLLKYRTIALGLSALAALIYGLIMILEVPAREVAILFFVACLFVATTALLGFICSFLFSKIKFYSKNKEK
tara:strand:+ start:188 stop:412 length:225 start_codon:yes stop_codon:yes gene_type:complete